MGTNTRNPAHHLASFLDPRKSQRAEIQAARSHDHGHLGHPMILRVFGRDRTGLTIILGIFASIGVPWMDRVSLPVFLTFLNRVGVPHGR